MARGKSFRETVNLLFAIISVVEPRRAYAVGHSKRVAELARLLAGHLKLSAAETEAIYAAALLHDIGYLALPDEVLSKTEPLTPKEAELLKSYPQVGVHLLSKSSQLDEVGNLIKYHRHRFDGQGGEGDLAGKYLPLGSRIINLVESFDALINPPPHRPKMSVGQALAQLETDGAFDPDLVKAFQEVLRRKIRARRIEPAEIDAFSARLTEVFKRVKSQGVTAPVFPRLVEVMNRLLSNDRSDLKQISHVIELEPSLALKIVSVANSSLYSGVSPAKSVAEALVRIGLDEARDLLITFIYQNMFQQTSGPFLPIMEKWWEHSLMSAVACQSISVRARFPQPNYGYLLGLLHDIGKPCLLAAFAEEWGQAELEEEQRTLLLDFIDRHHRVVGEKAVKASGLPEAFVRAVRYQGRARETDLAPETLMVSAANDIVKVITSGQEIGEGAFQEIVSIALLNLSPHDLEAVVQAAVQRFKSVRQVLTPLKEAG